MIKTLPPAGRLKAEQLRIKLIENDEALARSIFPTHSNPKEYLIEQIGDRYFVQEVIFARGSDTILTTINHQIADHGVSA